MRRAPATRPGIAGPPHFLAAGAAGVIALMGAYGFANGLQREVDKLDTRVTRVASRDNVQVATAAPVVPSLVYAVADPRAAETDPKPEPKPAPIQVAETKPSLPEPKISDTPVEVNLVAAPAPRARPPALEVAAALPAPPALNVTQVALPAAAQETAPAAMAEITP